MMRKRDSVASYRQTSRFSTSTEGSRLSQPPPVPDKGDIMDILPRVSLSTHDGRSVDLHLDSHAGSPKDSIPQLPHIPFPSIPLSESMDNNFPSDVSKKRMSRAISTSSKRMSFMTELRSKRDKSDTASLMTVDQITEAVENRRASGTYGREEDLDGWTKVDSEIEDMVPKAVADDGVEDEDVESEISEDEEDETLHNEEEEELSLDVDDDGVIRNVLSAKRGEKALVFFLSDSPFSFCSKQMDQGCSYWCWVIWKSLSWHGRFERFAYGCKTSRTPYWVCPQPRTQEEHAHSPRT